MLSEQVKEDEDKEEGMKEGGESKIMEVEKKL